MEIKVKNKSADRLIAQILPYHFFQLALKTGGDTVLLEIKWIALCTKAPHPQH